MLAGRSPASTRTTIQPSRSKISRRRLSHLYCRWSVLCCSPSYSTATLSSGQPMSRNANISPNSSLTGICVRGRGIPASINVTLNQDSFGDCAPASNNPAAVRARRTPLRPGYLSIKASMSVDLTSVARAKASTAATAVIVGYQQPRSRAVLAGVVTGKPAITSISSVPIWSPRGWIPGNRCRLSWINSTGFVPSIHSLPCTAAAENPAITPCRPVHSHPAWARSSAVISIYGST